MPEDNQGYSRENIKWSRTRLKDPAYRSRSGKYTSIAFIVGDDPSIMQSKSNLNAAKVILDKAGVVDYIGEATEGVCFIHIPHEQMSKLDNFLGVPKKPELSQEPPVLHSLSPQGDKNRDADHNPYASPKPELSDPETGNMIKKIRNFLFFSQAKQTAR